MKHYGATPPWSGPSEFGTWRWRARDLRVWDDTSGGYWELELHKPRSLSSTLSVFTDMVSQMYLPQLREFLNSPSPFEGLLEDDRRSRVAEERKLERDAWRLRRKRRR